MSEESISYGEDKENLLYISKKINVDEFGLGEDGPFRESISSVGSEQTVKLVGSEITILADVQNTSRSISHPEIAKKLKPFHLKWSFGMSSNIGVINLTTDTRKELFFASAHSVIVYNYCTREMRHLEAHQSYVNCISSDSWGNWLVSCDGDKDGCLVIWSSKDLFPVFTIFNTHTDGGLVLAAISPCARYLVTIGESFENYHIDFWLWTLGEEKANDTFLVNKMHGLPVKICFNPDIEEHIMLVFQYQVFFIVWNPETNKIVTYPTSQLANKDKIGLLTSGTYMKECHESYASSSRGCVLVFRNTLYSRNYEAAELNNSKMYINAVKVSPASINAITTTEGILVVGDAKGHILFFDRSIRILYWIRNLGIGPVTSISFNLSPKDYRYENSKIVIQVTDFRERNNLGCDIVDKEQEITKLVEAPFDATLDNRPFTVSDFFLSTTDCNLYFYDFIRNICTPLFQIVDANISCIDAHDEMPYIVIGYENGRISLLDFQSKEQIANWILPKTEESATGGDVITCIKYSHESLHLICGRQNGEVWILEPVVLTPKSDTPFKYTKWKIEKIDFSYDNLQFAYFDSGKTVALFNYNPEEVQWVFQGKIRSHYDTIHDILFVPTHELFSTLYSIGADRHLVEYNNANLLKCADNVAFDTTMRDRIEQTAKPMTFTYYERVINKRNVGYFLLADDKHKIKIIHAPSKIPRALVLAPSQGCFQNSHIKKMRVLYQQMSRYMVFCAGKHLGIHAVPPDGNPFKYTGYLAHPVEVADFVISHDGSFVFSYGVNDRSVLQWEIKPRCVDLLGIMGGTELEPFYCLLEGGKNGWLFQEIQDMFFYMQILQQENIDLPRRVSDSINLSEVPDLVRTCGYYPSHFELEIMMMDIRYRDYDESGVVRDELSFVEFVKLFINHKPVYGYSMDDIREKFGTICKMADYPRKGRIESSDLVYLLQTVGEPSASLHKSLTSLLRLPQGQDPSNFDFLPQEITLDFFFRELLGIDPDKTDDESVDAADSDSNLPSIYF